MLHRTLFEPEHDLFRDAFRKFVETEITPYHATWEANQQISRDAWLKAGEQGFLCPTIPEPMVAQTQTAGSASSSLKNSAMRTRAAPVFRYILILLLLTAELWHRRTKTDLVAENGQGQVITAIAMTEPNTGLTCRASRPVR